VVLQIGYNRFETLYSLTLISNVQVERLYIETDTAILCLAH
jgi:hypothetical protein